MRRVFHVFLIIVSFGAALARAQESVPTVLQSIPNQPLAPGGPAVTIDLRNYFALPGVNTNAALAQFETNFGRFNVELRADVAPQHVANFLAYANSGAYENSIVHRSASFDGGPVSIVQGGAFRNPPALAEVPRRAPIPLEYNLPNARGTLAAARGEQPNSATSEWFINVRDNSTMLDPGNSGGYTVFGRVLGAGMTVVDQIAALPRTNAGPALPELPVRNHAGGALVAGNFVLIQSIQSATLFPIGGGVSAIDLLVENSAPTVVSTLLSGSTLTLTPLAPGDAIVTVRAIDPHGSAAALTFSVSIPSTAPVFSLQPVSQSVATGSTVVFRAGATGAANFRWVYNGSDVATATNDALVLEKVTRAEAGTYTVYASNELGETASSSVTLTVVDVPPGSVGRLINLSILTDAGAGERVLTVGAVIGPFTASGSLPLVLRAVGPTLADTFNIPEALSDPVMTLYAAGNSTSLDANDDWGGTASMVAAFASVGAFSLPSSSRDSAMVRPAPGVGIGGYTVQISGKGNANGVVLAEIYDAGGADRSATSARLINVSTLAFVESGTDLAAGFVIGGQTARTVLVRGVGPSLTRVGVTGVMPDPKLELFNNDTGQRIGGNDDWAGALDVSLAGNLVGAFSLAGGTSKDAALLVTLPPGAYSARLSGANGVGGIAIVEVYEVP